MDSLGPQHYRWDNLSVGQLLNLLALARVHERLGNFPTKSTRIGSQVPVHCHNTTTMASCHCPATAVPRNTPRQGEPKEGIIGGELQGTC